MGVISAEMLQIGQQESNTLIKVSGSDVDDYNGMNQVLVLEGPGGGVAVPVAGGDRPAREVHVQHHALVTGHRSGEERTQNTLQVNSHRYYLAKHC